MKCVQEFSKCLGEFGFYCWKWSVLHPGKVIIQTENNPSVWTVEVHAMSEWRTNTPLLSWDVIVISRGGRIQEKL